METEKDINKAINFIENRIKQFEEDITYCKNRGDEVHIEIVSLLIKHKRISEIVLKKLLKEKPKKVEHSPEVDDDMVVCPICEKEFEIDYDEHCDYCPSCGQKLDWSDIEKEMKEMEEE